MGKRIVFLAMALVLIMEMEAQDSLAVSETQKTPPVAIHLVERKRVGGELRLLTLLA